MGYRNIINRELRSDEELKSQLDELSAYFLDTTISDKDNKSVTIEEKAKIIDDLAHMVGFINGYFVALEWLANTMHTYTIASTIEPMHAFKKIEILQTAIDTMSKKAYHTLHFAVTHEEYYTLNRKEASVRGVYHPEDIRKECIDLDESVKTILDSMLNDTGKSELEAYKFIMNMKPIQFGGTGQ